MIKPLPPLARSSIFPVLLLLLFASSLLVRQLLCSLPRTNKKPVAITRLPWKEPLAAVSLKALGSLTARHRPYHLPALDVYHHPSPFRTG